MDKAQFQAKFVKTGEINRQELTLWQANVSIM